MLLRLYDVNYYTVSQNEPTIARSDSKLHGQILIILGSKMKNGFKNNWYTKLKLYAS